ncbi:hypothetical protein EIQ14_10030 [Xanthomonas campestris pv. campestris]
MLKMQRTRPQTGAAHRARQSCWTFGRMQDAWHKRGKCRISRCEITRKRYAAISRARPSHANIPLFLQIQ